jgi:nicotinamide-nucleotide amidase
VIQQHGVMRGASNLNEYELLRIASRVAELLEKSKLKVVFAESCTAGRIAATLSKVPGISASLCGSFVTYRNDSKNQWLGVRGDDLSSPKIGPVSESVARQMAIGALNRTPEADVAVSITGHLGPNAPEVLDGIAYSAICFREGTSGITKLDQVNCIQLDQEMTIQNKQSTLREERQASAVAFVLNQLVLNLESKISNR